MDRRHLEYFVAVAESGSFTRAAAALSIAQPSLSHAIAWLERDLGSQLFDRHGRGVRLTPAGEALLDPARRTLRSFRLARGAVRRVAEGGFGQLSIITNTLSAIDPLAAMVGRFRAENPGVQISIADPARRSDVLDAVRLGSAELGLVDGIAPSGPLTSRLVAQHELVAVLPRAVETDPSHPSVAQLAGLGLISTPVGTALRALLDEQLEAAGQPAEVAVETAHLASVVPLVLAGAGVALLPHGLAAEAAAKGARVRPLERPVRTSVHLIWRTGRVNALTQHFLDTCAGDSAPAALADVSDSHSV